MPLVARIVIARQRQQRAALLRSEVLESGVAAGGVSFNIDGGDKRIDAVQLTMGRGTIKIPVIQFSVEQVFAPQSLNLNFTATLTDGDADSRQDAFTVALS